MHVHCSKYITEKYYQQIHTLKYDSELLIRFGSFSPGRNDELCVFYGDFGNFEVFINWMDQIPNTYISLKPHTI